MPANARTARSCNPAPRAAERVIRRLAIGGQHCASLALRPPAVPHSHSRTWRTSTHPSRPGGIFAAMRSASSMLCASIR